MWNRKVYWTNRLRTSQFVTKPLILDIFLSTQMLQKSGLTIDYWTLKIKHLFRSYSYKRHPFKLAPSRWRTSSYSTCVTRFITLSFKSSSTDLPLTSYYESFYSLHYEATQRTVLYSFNKRRIQGIFNDRRSWRQFQNNSSVSFHRLARRNRSAKTSRLFHRSDWTGNAKFMTNRVAIFESLFLHFKLFIVHIDQKCAL